MPDLILLNGPPGVGKSTLARRYVADHPLAFCLDIDGIRALLGQWDQHEQESGRLARAMAVEMVRTHLTGGHAVVVPQLLMRPQFIDELERVATDAGAQFVEIWLMDEPAAALARYRQRALDLALVEHHRDADRMLGGEAGWVDVYRQLEELLPQRASALVVRMHAGDVDASYRAMLDVLG